MSTELAASSTDDALRLVDDNAFHKETSVAFSDWQASAILNPSRDATMSRPQLEEFRPGSRPGPRVHQPPIPEHHAGSAKFYVPAKPRHLFEAVPEPVAIQAGGKLSTKEWENEVARSILALYRADVSRRAGASAPIAAHLAYKEPPSSPHVEPKRKPTRLQALGTESLATGTLDSPSSSRSTRAKESLDDATASESQLGGGWAATSASNSDVYDAIEAVAATVAAASQSVDEAHPTTKPKKTKKKKAKSSTLKAAVREPPRPMLIKGPPVNRKGEVLPTISGGAGGSRGFAYLRGGPYPVWFGGSGAPISSRVTWCGLAGVAIDGLPPELTSEEIAIAVASGQCIHSLCNALTVMEREGRYADYVEVISKLLLPGVRTEVPRSEVLERQWRQLLAVGHVFALNYIEEGRFGPALAMLKRVEQLLSEDMMMDVRIAREIKAFVDDGYSYYYYSRGKYQAALQCSHKAMRAHASLDQWQHVAKCHLHTGVLMSRLRQHGEAIRCNGQILQMVDEGKLEGNGTDQEKICMIAICYHNIAVDHLMLQQVHEACVASQNARRLARLCLAYANRYMRFFESTHGTALEALEKTKDVRESFASREDRKLFKNLSADLYS